MTDTVKIKLSSWLNINFNHEIDTGILREDWEEMDNRERFESVAEVVFEKAIEWSEVEA